MANKDTCLDYLLRQGISRRAFLKFCAVTASSLALPAGAATLMAQTLATTPRPTVIWLGGQECTGCSESLLRSFEPTIENLLLDHLSLDYHNTLQAAAGTAAEAARNQAVASAAGRYILVVDGSIPARDNGAWAMIGGKSVLAILQDIVPQAGLIIAVGNCAAFGGIAGAFPNPSLAAGMAELMEQGVLPNKPLVNVSGCPPVPEAVTGTIVYYLTYGVLPPLDSLRRPRVYYGKTVHDCCSRLPAFDRGFFAQSFDDEAARQGACLYLLGCKGPETFNSCSTTRWNGGTSFPMHSGHGCLGCSEPHFWDRAGPGTAGFYTLQATVKDSNGGSCAAPNVQPLFPRLLDSIKP